jgi:hypothetical protein
MHRRDDMTTTPEQQHRGTSAPVGNARESRAEQIGSVAIGILFVVVAVAILSISYPFTSVAEPVAGLVIGALGLEALVSARRRTRSLLSRIGPLP